MSVKDRSCGKSFAEYIFAILGFFVSQETKRRPILAEAMIQALLFIPSVLVVVDIMVCLRVCKMELWHHIRNHAVEDMPTVKVYLIRTDADNIAY